MQVPARPPAAAAMAGATIDALSGGRFIFGFGPSGPQVSEGWYGVEYAKPWGRTREYIEIVREIVARKGPLEHSGEHWKLPIEGGTGQGKALKLNFHPVRDEIPVFVGAIGRKSVEMAAEICDGWIPIFFSADKFEETWGEHLEAGFAKGGRTRADLEISPSVQVAIDGDLDAARAVVKAGLLLYLGGMGSRKTNFYVDLTHRFGFGEVADEVQGLYLDGKRDEAYNAIPDELVNATSLVGTEDEVAQKIATFSEAGVDRLICSAVHFDKDQRLHTIKRLAARRRGLTLWRPGPQARPRTAFITGAGSGIGAATAERLAGQGWRLALVDLDEAAAQATAERCGADAVAFGADITDSDSLNAAVDAHGRALRRHRPLLRQRRHRDRGHDPPHRSRGLRRPGRREPRRHLPDRPRVPPAPDRLEGLHAPERVGLGDRGPSGPGRVRRLEGRRREPGRHAPARGQAPRRGRRRGLSPLHRHRHGRGCRAARRDLQDDARELQRARSTS